MAHGVSAITIDYNKDHNRVQIRIKVEDKWLDLLLAGSEAVEFANSLLTAESYVDYSVEVNPIEVYNDEDDHSEKTPYEQAVERQAKPDLRLVEAEEEQSGNLI